VLARDRRRGASDRGRPPLRTFRAAARARRPNSHLSKGLGQAPDLFRSVFLNLQQSPEALMDEIKHERCAGVEHSQHHQSDQDRHCEKHHI